MKSVFFIFIYKQLSFLITVILFLSCNSDNNRNYYNISPIDAAMQLTDQDNNGTDNSSKADSVQIGNQIWMTENLNAACFQNGDTIPVAYTHEDWDIACDQKRPVCTFYDFNTEYAEKYGRLYNWYAVIDTRELAPEGWAIATRNDYVYLLGNLSEEDSLVYISMLEGGKSGFNAQLSGFYFMNQFRGIENSVCYWTSTDYDEDHAWDLRNFPYVKEIEIDAHVKEMGLAVRCLKVFTE
ncbi:MAG: fibrobacter succinogenes major paralogous domain-containing protein [Bacteroidota bacterium]